MPSQGASQNTGRASYLLLVALLPPMGTLVLVVYFFSRLAPALEVHGVPEAMAVRLIAVGAGVSAMMAALALVVLLVMNRQRARLERANKRLTEMVSSLIEERVRMTRNLEALNGANQVTLAIKQESSFERIATVVLEQIEFFSKATDIVVFAASRDGELEPRARRLNSINSFGRDIDGENLECELPYEALIKNSPCRVLESRTANYSIAIPYATQEGMKGVVLVRRNILEDPDFEADLANFEGALIQLVRLVSVGLKFASLWDRAIKDEMTGLYNKNHFNAELPRLMANTLKGGKPFSLIMLDIDKFKTINDQCGHLAGDHVLRQVSSILIDSLRGSDMAFRFGGEELCVVCNGTVADNAAKFAERLRQIIAHTEIRFDAGSLIPVSASFGVAEFMPSSMTCENDLKDACDKALYEAKNGGRNRVVMFKGVGEFELLERGGDVSTEVKQRLGLAGDNTPLVDPAEAVDRRAPQVVETVPGMLPFDAAARAAELEAQPAHRPTHAESIRKVAEEIVAAVAGTDGSTLAEFAQIAGIAAAALSESRRRQELVAAQQVEAAGAASVDVPAASSAAVKPTRAPRRRATERRTVREVDAAVVAEAVAKPAAERRRGRRRGAAANAVAAEVAETTAGLNAVAEVEGAQPATENVDLPAIADQLKSLMAHVSRLQEAVTSQAKPPVTAASMKRPMADVVNQVVVDDVVAVPTNQSAKLEALGEQPEPPAKPKRRPRARKPKATAPVAEPVVDVAAESSASDESDRNTVAAAPSSSGLFGGASSNSKSWEPKRHW